MNILLDVLHLKKKIGRTPIWFMRQAGRYLPEYQAVRKKFDNFLDFTRSPSDAAHVTLQPLNRFDLDAAIIFSDILVVPAALGQTVSFKVGEGPQLDPWNTKCPLDFSNYKKMVQPTLDAITHVKGLLCPSKTLIGFAGAPWTLACYMITGRGSKDFLPTVIAAYTDPESFQHFIHQLVDATVDYIKWQCAAGADVIQIFDSWASLCPDPIFHQCVTNPISEIVMRVKHDYPGVPIVIFAKGCGYRLPNIMTIPQIDGLSLDPMQPLIANLKTNRIVMQGGLDPFLLYAGGNLMVSEAHRYLNFFKNQPYVFNLGHGIYKETSIAHVETLISVIRQWDHHNYA